MAADNLTIVFKLSLIDGIGKQLGPSYLSQSFAVRESTKYFSSCGRPCLELRDTAGTLESIRNRLKIIYDRDNFGQPDDDLEGGYNLYYKDDSGDLIVLCCDDDVNTVLRLNCDRCRMGVPIPLIARFEPDLYEG